MVNYWIYIGICAIILVLIIIIFIIRKINKIKRNRNLKNESKLDDYNKVLEDFNLAQDTLKNNPQMTPQEILFKIWKDKQKELPTSFVPNHLNIQPVQVQPQIQPIKPKINLGNLFKNKPKTNFERGKTW